MSDALLFAALNRQHDYEDYLEAREAAIDEMVPELAAHYITDELFCTQTVVELYGDDVLAMQERVGEFIAQFEAAQTNEAMAEAGRKLWKSMRHHIAAAATYQAESDARTKVERLEKLDRDDADEHRAEAE